MNERYYTDKYYEGTVILSQKDGETFTRIQTINGQDKQRARVTLKNFWTRGVAEDGDDLIVKNSKPENLIYVFDPPPFPGF